MFRKRRVLNTECTEYTEKDWGGDRHARLRGRILRDSGSVLRGLPEHGARLPRGRLPGVPGDRIHRTADPVRTPATTPDRLQGADAVAVLQGRLRLLR